MIIKEKMKMAEIAVAEEKPKSTEPSRFSIVRFTSNGSLVSFDITLKPKEVTEISESFVEMHSEEHYVIHVRNKEDKKNVLYCFSDKVPEIGKTLKCQKFIKKESGRYFIVDGTSDVIEHVFNVKNVYICESQNNIYFLEVS